jgi:transcription antitermination factor NusG
MMDEQKVFRLGELVIESVFTQGWKKEFEDMNLIFVNRIDEENNLTFSLNEAQFVIDSFKEIIEHYKNMPKVQKNMLIRIINGRFKGCEGKVIDIDKCDKERPVMVRIDTLDFEGCCYIGYDDVKKIKF